ncbi:active breakpoint cluster region-related protein isoform X2 [Anopheles aquasalis]|uniref:active breakpoint cluster region-related protein isoform X2 n=1 Tax=Anopheles aquasalis TaxID=42839 RepID=UPI00215A6317|nr:active breakpoint cluster region-related protein isoform X2 [Anopheles aquasalis]XP_050084448.1 active breakpoint cluster region-related protein isoform X2 [Anopheles aquasalis]XP_050084458.1 active breakpoint cluster region-related protein isoform X2 [Anopheles aquasalis]
MENVCSAEKKSGISEKIQIWSKLNQIIKAAPSPHHHHQQPENADSMVAVAAATSSSSSSAAQVAQGPGESSSELMQLRSGRDGPLNQCISELTSNLHSRRCVSELIAAANSTHTVTTPNSSISRDTNNALANSNQSTAVASSATSTGSAISSNNVINHQSTQSTSEDAPGGGVSQGSTEVCELQGPDRSRGASQCKEGGPPSPHTLLSPPSHFVTVIEVKESQGAAASADSSRSHPAANSMTNNTTPATGLECDGCVVEGGGTKEGNASSGSNGSSSSSSSSSSHQTKCSTPKTTATANNNYENVLINTGGSVISARERFGGSMERLIIGEGPGQGVTVGGSNASTFHDPTKHPKPPPDRAGGVGEASAGGSAFTTNGLSISKRTSQLLGAAAAGSSSPSSSSSAATAVVDFKKKIPPRPPPKFVRRAAPVEPPIVPSLAAQGQHGRPSIHEAVVGTATVDQAGSDGVVSSSLERHAVQPTAEIYRQRSSDSLDVKLGVGGPPALECGRYQRSAPVTEGLKGRSSAASLDSPPGSLGKGGIRVEMAASVAVGVSPTGSLGKLHSSTGNHSYHSSSDSPTGSLGKADQTSQKQRALTYQRQGTGDSLSSVLGSKESLASGGGAVGGSITERIKSYESISSLSSDSVRAGGTTRAAGEEATSPGVTQEQEHYYDTVPLDHGDGDYVYIQPGGFGNDGRPEDNAATLLLQPLSHSVRGSQTSVQPLETESPGRNNYVNIEYFIRPTQNNENRSNSIDSDGEADLGPPPVLMRAISTDTNPATNDASDSLAAGGGIATGSSGLSRKISNANRNTIIRHIVSSIVTSETLYVECLNKMKQYMKAIRATLTTSQPVISEEEFHTIFFKIEELHEVHCEFLTVLRARLAAADLDDSATSADGLCVGEQFRKLASHIHLYGAFLHNYGRAIDTVKSCSTHSQQFKEIVSNIVFKNQNEQKLSLEELLHKPVARVQKNALVLEDLLAHTPEQHPDYMPLRQASKTMRTFLAEFNVVQTRSMFPSEDKALRRLVRNSFIVELADGHRKLRHLFLFNDVIACAKYKAAGRGASERNGFEFELKWFIPLRDILICEESANDSKEASPINIVQLKSQACTVRDQIMLDERDEMGRRSGSSRLGGAPGGSSRVGDKHRKKLADLEAQLVLASPNLVFKIGNKATSKTMTFFLSSDFERTQWIESILSLQQSCNLPGQLAVQIYDLQAWITACQALIKTEMGSYLMRNARDESLLVGDLHLTIQGLNGFDQPSCDLFVCVEIDSYGHYFRKAKTKLVCRSSSPYWNESFVLELEGSQNLRLLLYQDAAQRQILRAKHVLKLSRSWLQESPVSKSLKLSETLSLGTVIRFVPGEVTLRRVPTSKPGALFGAKLQSVIKREKRDIPFIVSACLREVERRGIAEVGIYRVSGSASDVAKLKKSFETNAYEAEQLLKEVDVHSVTGILKSYLRELPEALFTDQYYQQLFDTFNLQTYSNETARIHELQRIFVELPQPNRATINLLLDHLIRVHQQEIENKMSLHNLAMVFGPTLLRPGPTASKQKDLLESSTADVMTQAGILYSFLQARLK